MIASMNIHLEENTRVVVAPLMGLENELVVRLDDDVRLFFDSAEHLRSFAENILKQIEVSA